MKFKNLLKGLLCFIILSGCYLNLSHSHSESSFESSISSFENSSSISISSSSSYSSEENLYLNEEYKIPLDYVVEDGHYHDKDHVAAYIVTFKKLPSNYVKKGQNKPDGYSTGGDTFRNREGYLPPSSYVELDIDAPAPRSRGAKRIVYSTIEFKVYYTSNHYASFTLYKEHLTWGSYSL